MNHGLISYYLVGPKEFVSGFPYLISLESQCLTDCNIHTHHLFLPFSQAFLSKLVFDKLHWVETSTKFFPIWELTSPKKSNFIENHVFFGCFICWDSDPNIFPPQRQVAAPMSARKCSGWSQTGPVVPGWAWHQHRRYSLAKKPSSSLVQSVRKTFVKGINY